MESEYFMFLLTNIFAFSRSDWFFFYNPGQTHISGPGHSSNTIYHAIDALIMNFFGGQWNSGQIRRQHAAKFRGIPYSAEFRFPELKC